MEYTIPNLLLRHIDFGAKLQSTMIFIPSVNEQNECETETDNQVKIDERERVRAVRSIDVLGQ